MTKIIIKNVIKKLIEMAPKESKRKKLLMGIKVALRAVPGARNPITLEFKNDAEVLHSYGINILDAIYIGSYTSLNHIPEDGDLDEYTKAALQRLIGKDIPITKDLISFCMSVVNPSSINIQTGTLSTDMVTVTGMPKSLITLLKPFLPTTTSAAHTKELEQLSESTKKYAHKWLETTREAREARTVQARKLAEHTTDRIQTLRDAMRTSDHDREQIQSLLENPSQQPPDPTTSSTKK